MSTGQPQPVKDVNMVLRDAMSKVRRTYLFTVAGFVVLLLVAVGYLGSIALQQGTELRASCGVWRSLAGLPVTPAPPAKTPSRLGVVLVVSTRVAFQGQGCGELPLASPSLLQWAAYYHLSVP